MKSKYLKISVESNCNIDSRLAGAKSIGATAGALLSKNGFFFAGEVNVEVQVFESGWICVEHFPQTFFLIHSYFQQTQFAEVRLKKIKKLTLNKTSLENLKC